MSRFPARAGVAFVVLWLSALNMPAAQGPGSRADSPASQRPPQTTVVQEYPPAEVEAGRAVFAAQCGFCHGRDAMGGETGPDLTRSAVVAEDVRGDRIGAVVRTGRLDKKMPAFTLSDADLTAVVAFIHDAKSRADKLEGGRRAVDVADLQTGDPAAGRAYFEGPGGCTRCHSATGDLAGIGTRLAGLTLMEELLYPTGRGGRGARPPAASVTVTLPSGQTVTGRLAYRDEFTIAVTDASGVYHSWQTALVKAVVDDPLDAHFVQLSRYTTADLHNVFAYLQSLQR